MNLNGVKSMDTKIENKQSKYRENNFSTYNHKDK